MGHGAGVAAAMAARSGGAVQDVPYAALEKKLLAQRQVLSYDAKPKPADEVARDAGPGAAAPRKGKIDAAAVGGVVVDDDDAQLKGVWSPSTHGPYVGSGYVHDRDDYKGKLSATFVPTLPAAGEYEVRVIFPPASNRSTAVPVTVNYAGGSKTIPVNQRELPDGQPAASVGVFRFEAGKTGSVTISNEGTRGHVVVDAGAVRAEGREVTGATLASPCEASGRPMTGPQTRAAVARCHRRSRFLLVGSPARSRPAAPAEQREAARREHGERRRLGDRRRGGGVEPGRSEPRLRQSWPPSSSPPSPQ